MNLARRFSRDSLVGVSVCLISTVIAVLMAPDRRVLAVACGSIIQGFLGAALRHYQSARDSVARALVRLALFSPILVIPILYLVFRRGVGWPFITAWSAWALGFGLYPPKAN